MGASESYLHVEEGAVVVACSSQIAKPDADPTIVIINNYTTCDDLIDLVLTRCKARCLDASDFCVVMDSGPKGGPVNTRVLKNCNRPLELQAIMPKGHARFGVQPRSGVVVKIYDIRDWPVEPFGDFYLTPDYSTQQILSHLLSATVPKKKIAKLNLALGNSVGKVYQFLGDTAHPYTVYQEFTQTADPEETSLLIVKRAKPSKKLMLRSLSWASLTQSDVFSSLDRRFKKSKKKPLNIPRFSFDDTGSLKSSVQPTTSTPSLADRRAGFTESVNDKIRSILNSRKKAGKPDLDSKSATCPRGRPSPQKLPSSISCDNIFSNADKVSLKPAPQTHLTATSSNHETRSNVDVNANDEDYSHGNRCRSLGDIATNDMNTNLSVASKPASTMSVNYQHNTNNSGLYKRDSVSSDASSHVKLRNTAQRIYNKQARKSCVGRMGSQEGSVGTVENYRVSSEGCVASRENSTGKNEPRMRRTLPQIPSTDIDNKKERLAELMKRRLTVCGGEIPACDSFMTYNADGHVIYTHGGNYPYEDGRLLVQSTSNVAMCGNNTFTPVHESLSVTRSVPIVDQRGFDKQRNAATFSNINNHDQYTNPTSGGTYVANSGHINHPHKLPSKTDLSAHHDASATGVLRQRNSTVSPGKPHSDQGSDFGMNHVTAQSSMMDSGYATNGESECNSLLYTKHMNRGVGAAGDATSSPPFYSYLNRGHTSFSSNESDPAVSPDCHSSPKPQFDAARPTFYQILTACHVYCVEFKPLPEQSIEQCLSLTEISVNLPVLAAELRKNTPKGNYAIGLGGPGSAFKRVKKDANRLKKYEFLCVEWVAGGCVMSSGHGNMQKGDLLIEVGGSPMIGLAPVDVSSHIAAGCCPTVEMVIARRKLPEQPLTTEISKLRQQCSHLISEVKNKERSELAVFHSPDEPESPFYDNKDNLPDKANKNEERKPNRIPDFITDPASVELNSFQPQSATLPKSYVNVDQTVQAARKNSGKGFLSSQYETHGVQKRSGQENGNCATIESQVKMRPKLVGSGNVDGYGIPITTSDVERYTTQNKPSVQTTSSEKYGVTVQARTKVSAVHSTGSDRYSVKSENLYDQKQVRNSGNFGGHITQSGIVGDEDGVSDVCGDIAQMTIPSGGSSTDEQRRSSDGNGHVKHRLFERKSVETYEDAVKNMNFADTKSCKPHRCVTKDAKGNPLVGECNFDTREQCMSNGNTGLSFSPVLSKSEILCKQYLQRSSGELNRDSVVESGDQSASSQVDTQPKSNDTTQSREQINHASRDGVHQYDTHKRGSYDEVYVSKHSTQPTQNTRDTKNNAVKQHNQETIDVNSNETDKQKDSIRRRSWNLRQALKWNGSKASNETKRDNVNGNKSSNTAGNALNKAKDYFIHVNQSKSSSNDKKSQSNYQMSTFQTYKNQTSPDRKVSSAGNHDHKAEISPNRKVNSETITHDHNDNVMHTFKFIHGTANNDNLTPLKLNHKMNSSIQQGLQQNGVIRLYNCELGEDEFIV